MYNEERILQGKELVWGSYFTIVNPTAQGGKTANCFLVGSVIFEIYRGQVYRIERILKWAVLRNLETKKLETRSLSDPHFKLAEMKQLKLF